MCLDILTINKQKLTLRKYYLYYRDNLWYHYLINYNRKYKTYV